MRYGYYLAHTGMGYGDPELAAACRVWWQRVHLEKPLPFDGVWAWLREDGTLEARIFCRDFFHNPRKPQRVVWHVLASSQ